MSDYMLNTFIVHRIGQRSLNVDLAVSLKLVNHANEGIVLVVSELQDVIEAEMMNRRTFEGRLDDPLSCLQLVTTDQHVMLSPKYLGRIPDGIREQLNEKLKLYSEELGGVPIVYRSVRLKQNTGWLLEDQPYIHVDVIVEYIVFKPLIGSTLRAVANRQSGEDYIGGVVHGLFNVVLPPTHSRKFDQGDEFNFKVIDIHVSNNLLSMSGKLIKN